MRMRIWRLVVTPTLLLILSGLVAAAPPSVVEVPRPDGQAWAEVKTPPGRLLVLSAEPASKWLLVDEDGADLRSFDGGKSAAFAAPAPGRFKVIVTGPDGTPSRVVVVVGNAPNPGPGPAPKPPEPAPAPDALAARLRAAYDADPPPAASDLLPAADPAARKRAAKAALAELYRGVVKTCGKPEVATPDQLLSIARDSAARMIGPTSLERPGALAGVRTAVGDELGQILATPDPLTAAQRDAAAGLFRRAAEALDGF